MAWATTTPPEIANLLNKLRERHPDWHWTLSPNLTIDNGHTLTGSNSEVIRHMDWTGGVDDEVILGFSDKIATPPPNTENK